eukprot:7838439-Alexandrium_andersonii.AAC.1
MPWPPRPPPLARCASGLAWRWREPGLPGSARPQWPRTSGVTHQPKLGEVAWTTGTTSRSGPTMRATACRVG